MNPHRRRDVLAIGSALSLLVLMSPMFGHAQVPSSPPARLAFMVGEWEARIATNHYRIRVQWDKERNQFRGFLTKNGEDSASVGFRVGEHVWTALPIDEPDIVIELQKLRSGANGTSTKVVWRIGEVDLKQSSGNALVTTTAKFRKVE